MVKAIVCALAVFCVAFAIGWGVIEQQTSDNRVVNQSLIDKATAASDAGAAAAPTSTTLDSPSPQTEHAGAINMIESYRQETKAKLTMWCLFDTLAGLVVTCACLIILNVQSEAVIGETTAARGLGTWAGFLVLLMVSLGLVCALQVGHLNLFDLITSDAAVTCGLIFGVLQVLGYYVSTVIGVPTGFRASVPGANFFIQVRSKS